MTTLDADRIARVAAQIQTANEGAGMAFLLSQRYFHATTDEARAEIATNAGKEARKAHDASRDALDSLQDAGIVLSDQHGDDQVNPLTELRRVENSRTEALALLDALRHAHALAEALDAKRGDVLDTPVGSSAGLVWGDRLIQAVCGLELELYGPSVAITKGRE
jgi:hypothetical protein